MELTEQDTDHYYTKLACSSFNDQIEMLCKELQEHNICGINLFKWFKYDEETKLYVKMNKNDMETYINGYISGETSCVKNKIDRLKIKILDENKTIDETKTIEPLDIDENINNTKKYIEEVLPDKDFRDHVIKTMGDTLEEEHNINDIELIKPQKLSGDFNNEMNPEVLLDFMIKLHENMTEKIYTNPILRQVYGIFYDEHMESLLNNTPNTFPILNKKKINLITGEISERDSYDLFTFECPVSFTNDVTRAEKYFTSLFPNKNEREYVQKILGMQITGSVDNNYIFIWHGTRSNGKTTLSDIITKIMKNFVTKTTEDVFRNCRHDNRNMCQKICDCVNLFEDESNNIMPSPHIVNLFGKRMIMYHGNDAEQIVLNNTNSLLSKIINRDTIKCRNIYEDILYYKSNGSVNVVMNTIPEMIGDKMTIDKVRFIFFREIFPEKEYDEFKCDIFGENVKEEDFLDEIFTWIVNGSIKYNENESILMPESYKVHVDNLLR
jgi:phage/plasmid-associated DNA primase